MATKKKTQTGEILRYLQTHKGITSMQAFEKFGATRLSAIIFVLKKRGFNIVTYMIDGKNRYGEPTRYAEYRLIKDKYSF